jgi:hypothetical protein
VLLVDCRSGKKARLYILRVVLGILGVVYLTNIILMMVRPYEIS